MTGMNDFRPPKLNKAVMAICKWGLPLELIRAQVQVEVVGDGLQRFHELDGKHTVIVCNHSNQYDPEVMFAFSKLAGQDFHFLTAREVFDWVFGFVGWWFQSLGCYSVMRGASDVESFKMTRDIIASGKHKLVIFPEGEVTRQPDFLLPLRSGATRLVFQGQGELLQRHPGEPVYVLPIAVHWRYKHDITGLLDLSMRVIESRLGLHAGSKRLGERVFAAADAMLMTLEKQYFCPRLSHVGFEERVVHLRGEILRHIAALVDVPPPESGSQLAWLRRVHNLIYDFVHASDYAQSGFARQVHKQQARKLRAFIDDCSRVQQLIGVVPPPKPRALTQERLAAIVGKIERQVLGFVVPKGPRVALVKVGQPFSVLEYYRQFGADEHAALETVTQLIFDRLQALIDSLTGPPAALVETPQQIKSDGNLTIEIK